MSEEIKNQEESEEEEMVDVFTLTDEETGEEQQFELLAEADIDDAHYLALSPISEEEGDEEYVILRSTEEDGETMLYTIDDDETFDRVAEFFDDLFFNEVDCD